MGAMPPPSRTACLFACTSASATSSSCNRAATSFATSSAVATVVARLASLRGGDCSPGDAPRSSRVVERLTRREVIEYWNAGAPISSWLEKEEDGSPRPPLR